MTMPRANRLNLPLETILFDIFTGDGDANFRLPEHLWAVTEALNRVRLSTKPLWSWKVIKARKEQRCRRGCTIKPGEKYYIPRKRANFKLCAKCERLLWREKDKSWCRWNYRKANKDHRCSRGCVIKGGDYYFIYDEQLGGMKMCARCMAMVLYFKKAHALPAYEYLGWNEERKEPATVKDPILVSNTL